MVDMAFDRDKQILDFIDKSSRILVCFNSQYTIDSTASALLIAHYLKRKGKDYTIACDGFESKDDHQLFSPEIESISTSMESPQRFVISLDIGKSKIKEFSYDVDGNKLNNHQNNLEIITPSENNKHAYRIGLKSAKGSKNNLSILNEDEVSKIKSRLNNKEFCKDIAVDYGVSIWCIHNIKQGKTWKEVSSATTIENTSIDGSE